MPKGDAMTDHVSAVQDLAADLSLEILIGQVAGHEELLRRAVELMSERYPEEVPLPDKNGDRALHWFSIVTGALMYEASRRANVEAQTL